MPGKYTDEPAPKQLKAELSRVHKLDNAMQHLPIPERKPPRLVGMRPAHIMAPIFTSNEPNAAKMSQYMLAAGVYGLMLENLAWLRFHPETPDLYSAGVTYKPERRRLTKNGKVLEYGEEWQTIPWVIYRGYGDCEDLGAWRAAELRAKYRIQASPYIKVRRMPDGFWRAHVVVRWPDGRLEDPAAKLGMYTFKY